MRYEIWAGWREVARQMMKEPGAFLINTTRPRPAPLTAFVLSRDIVSARNRHRLVGNLCTNNYFLIACNAISCQRNIQMAFKQYSILSAWSYDCVWKKTDYCLCDNYYAIVICGGLEGRSPKWSQCWWNRATASLYLRLGIVCVSVILRRRKQGGNTGPT